MAAVAAPDEVHAVHTGNRVFIRIQACIYRGWNIVGRHVGYAYRPADDIARIKAHESKDEPYDGAHFPIRCH